MNIDSDKVKEICFSHGADLAGIASADSFTEAPEGVHPRDVLPSCESVIVMACEFPKDSVNHNAVHYTFIRNEMTIKMNMLADAVSKDISASGYDAKPVKSITSSWINGRFRGPISLKHAAELAGLGIIGRNTLLVNDLCGNMIWLSAVLTSAKLKPDTKASYNPCIEGCDICVSECPVSAIGDEMMNQRACVKHAFITIDEKLEIQCWRCRELCPNFLGSRNGG